MHANYLNRWCFAFLFAFIMLGIGDSLLAEPSLHLEKIKGKKDTAYVYYDANSKTIDLYFTAKEDGQYFWDFNETNLSVYETYNGKKTPLPIHFQSRIQDTTRFSEQNVYQIKTRSTKNLHQERRDYHIVWLHPGGDSTEVSISKNWPVFESFQLVETYSFWDVFVTGALVLSLLLLLLSELIPFFRKRQFLQKFVQPYHKVQQPDERRLHPVTASPIGANEMVVVKCSQQFCGIPLSVWEKKNYQCWYYPNQCQGFANIGFKQFFTQTGIFRKLNWLWFGALGGLLAWTIFYALKKLIVFPNITSETLYPILMGGALGLGITSMLAWVEEKGQGRELSFARIVFKILLGVLASMLIFYLSTFSKTNALISGITWLLFCVTLGLILSINSSITIQRGLISGFLAGILSALVYVAIIFLMPNPEAEFTNLFTFIVAGGVLGYIIMQVVSRLEKIELEVISPTFRRGSVFSLDRWLNAGKKVTIGRDMKGCEVRVKWEDNYVLPQHVELNMKNNKVYITPLGDAEIWIMDSPLKNGKSQLLEGGEIIRLGRHSQTAFKYLQKT